MADMHDSRVTVILEHAKACRECKNRGKVRPLLSADSRDLSGIDLSGAELSYAVLTGVDLKGADLSGADLTGADLSQANLIDANLTEAQLASAYLYEANFTRANLDRAKLRNANLWGANLTGANLTDAELTGATLSFAILDNAKVTQGQLDSAGFRDVAAYGYPKEVAEKVILLQQKETNFVRRKAKKRLVVELGNDQNLYIKTRIFEY